MPPTEAAAVPRVVVLSRRLAEQYEPASDGEVCISIRTPGDNGTSTADLSWRFADVLRLAFVDADHQPLTMYGGGYGWLTPEMAEARGDVVFSPELARQVLEFVQGHADAPALLIHCDFGASRSPGLALGLADTLFPGSVSEADWPNHNRHVRETVRLAFHALPHP
jgi:predicted protein tyrosine phosphatase